MKNTIDQLLQENAITPYQALLLISLTNITLELQHLSDKFDKKPESLSDDKYPVNNFDIYLQTK